MSWVAVEQDGCEIVFPEKPHRMEDCGFWNYMEDVGAEVEITIEVDLPKGSIKKLIGKDLTWEDDPVELK